MRISVYTSCSANYLPKARVLAETFKKYHPDGWITLLLNDEIPPLVDFSKEQFDEVLQPKDLGYSKSWMFKHNVMELCTAVKGRGLLHLIQKTPDADLILYLDPDVVLYGDLSPMLKYMGEAEIGLVPHITRPETTVRGVQLTELSVIRHGTYNLGHLIVRPKDAGKAFASWWAERLDEYCYDDPEYGLFTDQRWCDLAPSIFDKVAILRQPNMDVASWNVGSRDLRIAEEGSHRYVIDGYPLLTYHFSGTGPSGTHSRVRQSLSPGNGAQAEIEREYEEAIERHGQDLMAHWPFAGNYFEDGTAVTQLSRKFYRRHRDLQVIFEDPFRWEPGGSCYVGWLRGNLPAFATGLVIGEHKRRKAFDDLFDATYYLERYPEVREGITDKRWASALDHYVKIGSRAFYDPNHYFVSIYYYEAARSLGFQREQGRIEDTILWHYVTKGLPSGIEPVPGFDSAEYFRLYPMLVDSYRQGIFSTPLAHFCYFGDGEGRRPSPSFDPEQYLQADERARSLVARRVVNGAFGAYLALGGVAGRFERRFWNFSSAVGAATTASRSW